MNDGIDNLERRIRELVATAGHVWDAWLATLPADDRAILVSETADGAPVCITTLQQPLRSAPRCAPTSSSAI